MTTRMKSEHYKRSDFKYKLLSEFWITFRMDIDYAEYFADWYNACHIANLIIDDTIIDNSGLIIPTSVDNAYATLVEGMGIDPSNQISTVQALMELSPNEEYE